MLFTGKALPTPDTCRKNFHRNPSRAELCISPNLLYSWKSSSQGARVGSEGGRAVGEDAAADDPRALRRENAVLRQENEILKKAAVILGTKTPPNYGR